MFQGQSSALIGSKKWLNRTGKSTSTLIFILTLYWFIIILMVLSEFLGAKDSFFSTNRCASPVLVHKTCTYVHISQLGIFWNDQYNIRTLFLFKNMAFTNNSGPSIYFIYINFWPFFELKRVKWVNLNWERNWATRISEAKWIYKSYFFC